MYFFDFSGSQRCISSRYALFCSLSSYSLLFQPRHISVTAVEVAEWEANTAVEEEDWARCWWLDSSRKCWESTSIIITAATIIITVIIITWWVTWWDDEKKKTFSEEELSVNSLLVQNKNVLPKTQTARSLDVGAESKSTNTDKFQISLD